MLPQLKKEPNSQLQKQDVEIPAPGTSLPSLSDSYARWKITGQRSDFDNIMKALEPTVVRGLDAYGGGRKELRTRARLIAADAVKMYDPERDGKKAQLSSFVHTNLQRLQRVSADRAAAVRLPERSRMDAILLREEVKNFEDKEGYEPDVGTLSEITGISRSRQRLASAAFKEIAEAGLETEKGDTLLQGTPDDTEDPWRDYVYHDLDPKSRKIFEWTTGYGGSKLLQKQEIARRLKMTPAAISSRIQTILERLQARPSGQI
jgi:DNA-directed RNA polymerase specialized sigma subunit